MLDHHVPAEDERLHLEGPGGEEIGGPLEAEAADAQRGEGQRRVGAPHCATGRECGIALGASGSERSGGEWVAGGGWRPIRDGMGPAGILARMARACVKGPWLDVSSPSGRCSARLG